MVQLVFFLLNASDAAAKMATSLAPAFTALWKPCRSAHTRCVAAGRRLGQHPASSPYLEVGRQRSVGDSWAAVDSRQHISAVAELGDPLGRHKAGGFNLAQPRRREHVDQVNLDGGVDVTGLILEAVPGPHFVNHNFPGQR
jgi:hypothetical protein